MDKRKKISGATMRIINPLPNGNKSKVNRYYFDKNGNRLNNTTFDGYAFDNDGVMASGGWIKLTDKWYYSNSSGKISQEKWEKIGNSWYYFDKNGIMLSNTIFNGYLFSNSGAMATNSWVKINEQWYYAQSSGKPTQLKWENIGNLGTSLTLKVLWPANQGKETISLKQVVLWLIKSGFSTKLTIAGSI